MSDPSSKLQYLEFLWYLIKLKDDVVEAQGMTTYTGKSMTSWDESDISAFKRCSTGWTIQANEAPTPEEMKEGREG